MTLAPRTDPLAIRQPEPGVDLHDFDLRPPILTIVQSQSGKGEQAGNLRRTDTDEEYSSLNIIPLRVQKSRTKWPSGEFSRDSKPECWSVDGTWAAPGALFEGNQCVGCEFFLASPFDVSNEERKNYCTPDYLAIFMDADSYDVYMMRLAGTAASLARKLAARGVIRRQILKLFTREQTNNRGKYYVPIVSTVGHVPEDDYTMIQSMAQDYVDQDLHPEESPAEAPTSPVEPSDPSVPTRRQPDDDLPF